MMLLVNNTDDTEFNSGRLIGVSHWLGNALCYWVLTEKGNIIARNILQHITRDEAENPEIQKSTSNYHIKLESDIGADYFLSYLFSMDEFINKEVPSQQEEDVLEEPNQGLPDSPDMDDVVDQENSAKEC